ncbi:MAG: PH domain-containing protein [Rhodospirillales bacterium]|nr:PH domain-containing protein [Rhodospirillales bacterium]
MSLELRPNEYAKIEVHFSYKVFVFPMLLFCIGVLMMLFAMSGAVDGINIAWMNAVVSFSSVIIFAGACLFIPYFYKRLDNRLKIYAVTNQRVYIRRGIINIHEKDIPLAKINDVQITRNLAQRFFGAGDVVIQVGNDESRICIEDVNYPLQFRDTIISSIYDLQQEEAERQREYMQSQQAPSAPNNYPPYNAQGGYPQNGYGQGGYNPPDYGQGGYNNSNDYNNGGFNPNRF